MSTPDPKEGAPSTSPPAPRNGKDAAEVKVNGRLSPNPTSRDQADKEAGKKAPSNDRNGLNGTDFKDTDSADPSTSLEKDATSNKTNESEAPESAEPGATLGKQTPEDMAEPAKDRDVEMKDVPEALAAELPVTGTLTTASKDNGAPPTSAGGNAAHTEKAKSPEKAGMPAAVNGVDENAKKASSAPKNPAADGRASTPVQPKAGSTPGSQPAGTSNDGGAAEASVAHDEDVAMQDTPAGTGKVAREREDDENEDQPLAKRQRTEPREDEVMVSTTTEEAKGPNALQNLEKWTDADLAAQPITPYQVREYRRVIAGVKKTKAGSNFKDAVAKMWPVLADAYLDRVKEPMDLGEMERRLRDGSYLNLGEFKRDLGLLYENSATFNGEIHDVTKQAWTAVETIWIKCLSVPTEEPPKSKQSKHMPSRHHEPRTTTHQASPGADATAPPSKASPERTAAPAKPKQSQPARRAPSASAASPTEKAKEQTFAVPPGGLPQIRRASNQAEGDRPKRAIQPPKPKDIDYSTRPANRKHQRPEMQFCAEVLRDVMDKKHYHMNAPFLQPVDPVSLNIPTYFSIIKKPMDLSTIEGKLGRGEYSSEKQFVADMDLMFNNCFKFNAPADGVHQQGKQLRSFFQAEWGKKDQWLAKHAPSKPASVTSDVQSDEESEAGGDTAAPADDLAVRQLREAIDEFQGLLAEQTNKMNKYYAQELPNEHLINGQNAVMSAVQKALLEVKQKLASHASKQPVAQKPKPAKATKAKGSAAGTKKAGSGGGGGRKSAGSAPAKKAPKKELPVLSETDKNDIAQAVGQLDSPYIEQAISIIKKDTGQAENDSGELELDIEQISQPALRKLWDICVKALPDFRMSSGNAALPVAESPAPAPKAGMEASKAKKKRKPMQAGEQEERIKAIKDRLEQIQGKGQGQGQSVEETINAQMEMDADSSDEDSEEE